VDDQSDFAQMMAGSRPPLDQALALIAATGRPGVDPDEQVRRLDGLALTTDTRDARSVCSSLFGPGGLRGDTERYYDAENSLIDKVLDRRAGIPITLAVIAIEVARRSDVHLVGIGMPGHFLLRDGRDPSSFFDAFDGGAALDPAGVQSLFQRLHGDALDFRDEYLAPTPPLLIVARVLNNLRSAYARVQDRDGMVRSLALQAELPGPNLDVRRRLADALTADGRFLDAAGQHDRLAALDPAHGEEHAAAALRLRAQLN